MRTIGLRLMSQRPTGGQRITVCLRNGRQLTGCHATMVYVGDRAGIVIYHRRKAINETEAKGWWPEASNGG